MILDFTIRICYDCCCLIEYADMAQQVERLTRNEKVRGSNPLIGLGVVFLRLLLNKETDDEREVVKDLERY